MQKITCVNPFNEEVVDEITVTSKEDILQSVNRAKVAQRVLRKQSLEERKGIVRKILASITNNADELAKLTTLETGLPIKDSKGLISALVERSEWFVDNADKYLNPDVFDIDGGFVNEIRNEPLGVAAIISSWNAPLSQTMWCATPAILAGNAVVHKPSEFSSLCCKTLQKAIDEAGIAPNIFQTIYGYKEEGQTLVANSDLIAFAGSVLAGQDIIKRAADNMSRVSMELGGKDIMLVLEDADIEQAAEQAVKGSNKHCGQSCNAIEIAYIAPSLYDAFIAKVKEYTEKSQPGNPILEETKLGPLANKSSYERFTRLFEDAKIKGATVICGGKRVGEKGYAVQPAVLENVSENMLIMQEEIFGPILPVKKLQDINAVIDEVNDSEYGLGFSVWTKNIAKGKEIASQVFVGTAVVNGLPRTDINSPWGGMRKSGLGRILSPIGMKVFTEPKNLRYPKE